MDQNQGGPLKAGTEEEEKAEEGSVSALGFLREVLHTVSKRSTHRGLGSALDFPESSWW